MTDDRERSDPPRAPRRPGADAEHEPEFQRRWLDSRELTSEQVDAAFRHGFEARDRFADRSFAEVREYLRESWEGMGAPARWEDVEDIIRGSYERYKGAGFGESTELADEALARFPLRTAGGSVLAGGAAVEREEEEEEEEEERGDQPERRRGAE